MEQQLKLVSCPKCKGTGYLQKYSSLDSGACFLCNTIGQLESKKAAAFKAAMARKKKQKNTRPSPPAIATKILGYKLKPNQKVWWREQTINGWQVEIYTVKEIAPFVRLLDNNGSEHCYNHLGFFWLMSED